MEPITDYKDKYKGRPAAVLGGGPSLPDNLKQLPSDTVLIAVNNHALHFCQPEFMVFMDIPNAQEFPELAHAIETFSGTLISQTPLSDVNIKLEKYWDGGFTSTLATWFGIYLGCDPVILCGMDCYQGEVKYAHPRPDFYHPSMDAPLKDHLNAWRPALEHCPHPERIKAMSGPLVEIFGAYQR
jgi:uncharacterized Rossmann fold enzyme